ncbi:hypothetical protein KP509_07G090500 [Ceratopteris richardii]|uniref:Dirigent protein n=1 Tax=Ceratopteris richardii TaxID=49495 RepID=A0A8T2UKJ7_CERRI|nr:hypothetical protein KP509_07G090500 [Ceratopteris richardii]
MGNTQALQYFVLLTLSSTYLGAALPCSSHAPDDCLSSVSSISFQLVLPSAELHTNTIHENAEAHRYLPQPRQPMSGPYVFSDLPLFQYGHANYNHVDNKENSEQFQVGTASGLYLADSQNDHEVRYIYLTATFKNSTDEEGQLLSGSLVIVGSLSAAAVSIAGGTGDFAFVLGQAKVRASPQNSALAGPVLLFEIELRTYPEYSCAETAAEGNEATSASFIPSEDIKTL